jgi:hypothetical protein
VLAVMKAKPASANKASSKGGGKQLAAMDDVDESNNRALRPAEVNS